MAYIDINKRTENVNKYNHKLSVQIFYSLPVPLAFFVLCKSLGLWQLL